MNVVGIAAHFYTLAFQFIAGAAEVGMQLCFYRRVNKRLPVFGAEYQVNIVFY